MQFLYAACLHMPSVRNPPMGGGGLVLTLDSLSLFHRVPSRATIPGPHPRSRKERAAVFRDDDDVVMPKHKQVTQSSKLTQYLA